MNRSVLGIGVTGFVALWLAGSLASSFAVVGCGLQCDRNPNELPVPYRAGVTTDAGKPWGSYETSGFPGPFLAFPPGRTYRLFHGLGACPKNVVGYLAFDETPVSGTSSGPDRSGTAPAAGNQFTIERVTPLFVDVRNDTCSDVHLRVTASEPDFTGGACTYPGEDAGNARTAATADSGAATVPADGAATP